ncbi:AAA family ATPase [Vibrio rumoiensis]|uniref:AAA family ATPase n=2 Tax=Vibrio TaxID=662 RepID=UPI000B5D0539|nr:AAA family ATPase [Vibrio rumoiensis]
MKLISLTLDGEYKGLANQSFNFSQTQGNILALIGLNGSGKSQLLELIAEIFAFLERVQREDFKVRTSLGFGFELIYQIKVDVGSNFSKTNFSSWSFATTETLTYRIVLDIDSKKPQCYIVTDGEDDSLDIDKIRLPYVVGYASGLNENLQRSFMKNAVQFYEIMRVRHRRRKALENVEGGALRAEINRSYLSRYPHIFSLREPDSSFSDYFFPEHEILESDTPISNMVFLDYDCVGIMLACLSVFSTKNIDNILEELSFYKPNKLVLQYDFSVGIIEEDVIKDIKMLLRVAGTNKFKGIGKPSTPEEYDTYELDYLSGEIELDLTDVSLVSQLKEDNYGDPRVLFFRLLKLQLLGIKNWQRVSRQRLLSDNFFETLKKPLKTKLPLSVIKLYLSGSDNRMVNFDDLSDGESQLIQIIATSVVFRDEQAIFLFDEPETHLNPSWRTYFHHYLSKALGTQEYNSQVFVSTHSPFMISSLKKEDILFFERDEHGKILMEPIGTQTYGSSFDVLIKQHFGLRSLISQTVVEAVKEHLPKDDHQASIQEARRWIESNLGDSMEKAYLLRKLQS